VLTPYADAYIDRSERRENFGRNEILLVGQPSEVMAFLLFELPERKAVRIDDAVLRLYALDASERGITVSLAEDRDWEETRITYTNAPGPGRRSVQSSPFAAGGWVEIDVTSLVRGKSEVSLVVSQNGRSPVRFAAREAGEQAPQLVVSTQPSGTGVRID
jgi:hypothetical protein